MPATHPFYVLVVYNGKEREREFDSVLSAVLYYESLKPLLTFGLRDIGRDNFARLSMDDKTLETFRPE